MSVQIKDLNPELQELCHKRQIEQGNDGSSDFIWDKEKELHRLFKKYFYKSKIKFAGHTECFKLTKQQLNKIL